MKAIESNLYQHENGTFYSVARRGGKLTRRSLKTDSLAEARRKLHELAVGALAGRAGPEPPPVPVVAAAVPLLPLPSAQLLTGQGAAVAAAVAPPPSFTAPPPPAPAPVERPPIVQALADHARTLTHLSAGAAENAERGRKAVARFAADWETFSPAEIWSKYRMSRMESLGHLLGSSCNHLLVFMNKFVPWCVRRGYLASDVLEVLEEIPRVVVNPRRIKVPTPEQVDELVRMVATEHAEGAVFLRFLAVTGLRLRGAVSLTWQRVDLDEWTMTILQKGGRLKVIPLTSEAHEILRSRMQTTTGNGPFELTQNDLETIERRLKKYARGLEIDLLTYHSFRHYFASRCLMSGLTVQEVARLLGHSDNGQLVLQTYGHVCDNHLKAGVAKLRLASGGN